MNRLHAVLVFLAVWLFAAAGCYNPWSDQQNAKSAAEARATPRELRAGSSANGTVATRGVRAMRVRVRTTPRYRSEVPVFDHQIETMVDDANRVLGPSLGIKLQIVATEPWLPPSGEDDLLQALNDLTAADRGDDVDWVVAVLGASHGFEVSFKKLGYTRHFDKHVVLRTPNEAAEHDRLAKSLDHLDVDEIEKLVRARKRHRATAVLLHELGHSLGVPHELDDHTMMNATYDTQVSSYSEGALALMRTTLPTWSAATPMKDVAEPLASILEATAPQWDKAERDELLALLHSLAAPAPSPDRRELTPRVPAPAPTPTVRLPPPPPPVAGLPDTDQALFVEATADYKLGRFRVALTKASELAKRYPNVLEVHKLQCDVARISGLMPEKQACRRYLKMAGK